MNALVSPCVLSQTQSALPIRIAHLVDSFSPVSTTFVYRHITGLEAMGLDNHVIAQERVRAIERPFPKVHLLAPPGPWHVERLLPGALRRLGADEASDLALWAARRQLARQLTRLRPDLIHAQFGPVGVLAAPVAARMRIPVVITWHGYDATLFMQDPRWRKRYRSLWAADNVWSVGVSKYITGKVRDAGAPPQRLFHIANAVDTSEYVYSDPRARFDGRHVRVLAVGRLVEKKAPLKLLQSFARAQAALRGSLDLTLDLVGDGPLSAQTRHAIEHLRLQDCVKLHGAVPEQAVRRLMSHCHLFMQHSLRTPSGDEEGQPISIIEAAASGLPVVSTRHSGIPEIVEHGRSGWLVDEGDDLAMGDELLKLAKDPESWGLLGRHGRTRVENLMNTRDQLQHWCDLYCTVMGSMTAIAGTRSVLEPRAS